MFEFEALGTRWWIEILDDSDLSQTTREAIRNRGETFEDNYSRFKEDSLVSELATYGQIDKPPKELIQMLDFAGRMNRQTDGLFNPLVGGKLREMGYGKANGRGNNILDLSSALRWDYQKVSLQTGQALDFGGFGKGWLIDSLASIMRSHGHEQFIINGGGDIFVWSNSTIELALENPFDPDTSLGSVKLQKGALAASSTLKRTWSNGDKKYHHIIDPRSENSATGARASFVITDSSLVADSIATILIIDPKMELQLANFYNFKAKIIY